MMDDIKFLSLTVMWIPSAESYLCIIIDEREDTYRGYGGRPSLALEEAVKRMRLSDPNTGPITLTIFQDTGETSAEHLREKDLRLSPPLSFGQEEIHIGGPPDAI